MSFSTKFRGIGVVLLALAMCVVFGVERARAQFDSSSTGADGALTFVCAPEGETIDWDAAGMDPEGDRVFHFTTITVPAECTIRLRQDRLGPRPVHWLATGDVVIDGVVNLSGDPGHLELPGTLRLPSVPGAGGFAGGAGPVQGIGTAEDGYGPGAGKAGGIGGGAGHAGNGGQTSSGTRGFAYGTPFIRPLIGGSGGGGSTTGGGGGAGGGAILIASTTSVQVNGSLLARGAGVFSSGSGGGDGGGGSGGAIRVVAPVFSGAGSLSVSGGDGRLSGNGSVGRIRIETNAYQFSGGVTGSVRIVALADSTVLFSADDPEFPILRVTTVDGIPVPPNPTGGFTPADVTINEIAPVVVEIEAQHVPVGTTVTVEVHNETTGTFTFDSTPLAGTEALSTATANGLIDPGFSQVTLRANFAP